MFDPKNDGLLEMIQDVCFLALVLWREARGEPALGKVAVAQSIMNRVHRPSWWGDSVLAVVSKKWQYSSMTDPHDPQLTSYPTPTDRAWQECMSIALHVVECEAPDPAPGADSYYAVWMDEKGQTPKWADPAKFVTQIGNHKFYDLDADHERSAQPAV